jgi:signal transduction histidine kinase
VTIEAVPTEPSSSRASIPGDALDLPQVRDLMASVVRACDVVFGSICMTLAAVATWLHVVGQVHLSTVLALWAMPAFNAIWSGLTRRLLDRKWADLTRGLVCLPLASFLYVSEQGVLKELWTPALCMSVGIGLCLGVSSRRGWLGCLITLCYGGGLLGATVIQYGTCAFETISDALGISLTGCVISLVSNMLGRVLTEARLQRDAAGAQKDRAEAALLQLTQRSLQLTTAIETLHVEMATRMRVEIQLRHAQKLESVGRLAAGVAHEINTPVQFVSDSLQFVRAGVTELFGLVGAAPPAEATEATEATDLPYLQEHLPKALDRAVDGLDRVAAIVRSMKEFAHPESKDMTSADLNRAIASTLMIARNEYKYVAELETDFGDLPLVLCHLGELNQAVLNVVVNAAHAINDVVQGTDTMGKLRVKTCRDGDEVVIAITDTGGGIPEAARDHIFDPFFTTKTVGRGTGQGLAIARSVIVDKHHGRLEFETALGQGTTFYISLPIAGHARDAQPAVA